MKIFIIFATLICITIISPTEAEEDLVDQPSPVCQCFCPELQLADYFDRTDLYRPCKCRPLTCYCPRCSPTPIITEKAFESPEIEASATQLTHCNCPLCPSIPHPIFPRKIRCICPEIACMCLDCAEQSIIQQQKLL